MARKILLADDSVTAQNMGRRILTDAGYEVMTVNNGSAALKKISESKPDLIVLDVYMPGYGGLEVCQRIREGAETARIPVLLTVGKLEPFKADDARRVRADAYIVKPFEASELLTALTKLEDKIVPQAKSYQPGRFAKAIAAVEESGGADFGDTDTGWKSRLKIPPPHAKHHEMEPQVAQPSSTASPAENAAAEASPRIEHSLLSALPSDVTSEEIAALHAAAAAFSAEHGESSRGESSASAPQMAEIASKEAAREEAATLAQDVKAPVVEEKSEEHKPEEAKQEPQASAPESEAVASTGVGAEEQSASATVVPDASSVSAPQHEGGRNLHDEEVAAALASLAPTNGQGSASWSTETASWSASSGEAVPATMAAGAAGQELAAGFSGPRWIAQEIPLAEDDSTLILEEEMHKAYAAMAAAEADRASFAAASSETSRSATYASESSASETSAESTAEQSFAPSSGEAPTRGEESSAESSTLAVAQPAETTPVEASIAPVSESAETQSSPTSLPAAAEAIGERVAEAGVAEAGGSEKVVSEVVVSEVREEAAYAAAASATFSSAPSVVSAEATPETTPAQPSDNSVRPSEEGDERREAQLAAAWANWKQIRESVVGSEPAGPVAEAVTDQPAQVQQQEPSAVAPQSEAAASPADEASSVASIVDSVLAELKPKLMEEIARKMGKGKK